MRAICDKFRYCRFSSVSVISLGKKMPTFLPTSNVTTVYLYAIERFTQKQSAQKYGSFNDIKLLKILADHLMKNHQF